MLIGLQWKVSHTSHVTGRLIAADSDYRETVRRPHYELLIFLSSPTQHCDNKTQSVRVDPLSHVIKVTPEEWIALEQMLTADIVDVHCELNTESVSSNTRVPQIYTQKLQLSFLHSQPFFKYAEASCFRLLLFCLTHRRADILLEYQSQLHICLKDYPLSFLCTHCGCHNGKLESDTRVFLSPQPGTLNQAIKDVEALVDKEEDGSVLGIWLMAE